MISQICADMRSRGKKNKMSGIVELDDTHFDGSCHEQIVRQGR